MEIHSPIFKSGDDIPPQYTCDGEDINPPLTFDAIPVDAKSLVIIMDDPDSPTGTWTHWLLWNISPNTKEIGEGSVPRGAVQGGTTFGASGYGGPCPGHGKHRYFFKCYALDVVLDIPEGSKKEILMESMKGHILAEAEMYGCYQRKK
ncbi:MAG: YbhB/YbcL family Raf kinase inhibitor-like protein [bacterium]|nr:YbhB/YbcL family Raf kinase inhibitor-like protein [bacterium]